MLFVLIARCRSLSSRLPFGIALLLRLSEPLVSYALSFENEAKTF